MVGMVQREVCINDYKEIKLNSSYEYNGTVVKNKFVVKNPSILIYYLHILLSIFRCTLVKLNFQIR